MTETKASIANKLSRGLSGRVPAGQSQGYRRPDVGGYSRREARRIGVGVFEAEALAKDCVRPGLRLRRPPSSAPTPRPRRIDALAMQFAECLSQLEYAAALLRFPDLVVGPNKLQGLLTRKLAVTRNWPPPFPLSERGVWIAQEVLDG